MPLEHIRSATRGRMRHVQEPRSVPWGRYLVEGLPIFASPDLASHPFGRVFRRLVLGLVQLRQSEQDLKRGSWLLFTTSSRAMMPAVYFSSSKPSSVTMPNLDPV